MVKTPKTRHSKTRREPLTIDLEPGAVSSISDEPVRADTDSQTDESLAETMTPEDEIATEAGTAAHPEQEYQPAASAARQPSAYGFEAEAEAFSAGQSHRSETPAAAPPPRRGSFSRLLAGVIGGVVALVFAGVLQYAGVLGSPGAGSGSSVAQADIDGLKQEIAALRDAGGGDITAKVDGLMASLDTVKSDVLALQQAIAAGAGGENAGLQALDARVKEIETSLSALNRTGPAADQAALAAIGDRITAVEAALKSATEASAAGDAKVTALEASIAGLTAKVDAQAAQPKIALAIATAALKSAIDRGAPFTAELETFAAIAPQAPEIPALRALAEKGVPTRDDLVADMDEAADAMIAAAEPVDQNAGFFDRLLDSAESLVTVRPIGAVEGTGVPEIVARMEMALIAGNLDQAIAEFDSLPDTAKAAGGAFAERLKTRQTVEKLVDQAIAGAMKA